MFKKRSDAYSYCRLLVWDCGEKTPFLDDSQMLPSGWTISFRCVVVVHASSFPKKS